MTPVAFWQIPPHTTWTGALLSRMQNLAAEGEATLLSGAKEAIQALDRYEAFQNHPLRERVIDGVQSRLVRLAAETGGRAPTSDEWRERLGRALFEGLRLEHRLHSPSHESGSFALQTRFDSWTGMIERVDVVPKGTAIGYSPDEKIKAFVFITYDPATDRFWIDERVNGKCLFYGRTGNLRVPPAIAALIESLDGRRPIFPSLAIPRGLGNHPMVEIDPEIFRRNISYAHEALAQLKTEVLGSLAHGENVVPFTQETTITVFVASNGSFVGFRYWQPSHPDAFYEVGLPGLGSAARVVYDVYRHGVTWKEIRVPRTFRWSRTPNAFQKTAVLKWQRYDEHRIRSDPRWRLVTE